MIIGVLGTLSGPLLNIFMEYRRPDNYHRSLGFPQQGTFIVGFTIEGSPESHYNRGRSLGRHEYQYSGSWSKSCITHNKEYTVIPIVLGP